MVASTSEKDGALLEELLFDAGLEPTILRLDRDQLKIGRTFRKLIEGVDRLIQQRIAEDFVKLLLEECASRRRLQPASPGSEQFHLHIPLPNQLQRIVCYNRTVRGSDGGRLV